MTEFNPTVDTENVTEVLKTGLEKARLQDFSRMREGDGPVVIKCKTSEIEIEASYTPPKDGALATYHRFYMRRENPPLSVTLENTDEVKEREILALTKLVSDQLSQVHVGACSAGLDVIRKAFDSQSDHQGFHLTDVRVEQQDKGGSKVTANLVIDELKLTHTPGKYPPSLNTDKIFAKAGDDNDLLDNVVLQVELRECDDPTNPYETSIEASVSTEYSGVLSRTAQAKILYGVLTSDAEILSQQAFTVGELATAVRESSFVSQHLEQVIKLRDTLRRALLFSLSDSTPINRRDIEEGDLVAHLRPDLSPGFSLEVYRVTELSADVKEAKKGRTMKITSTSEEGPRTEQVFKMPDGEAYLRSIDGAQLPTGAEGSISFFIDSDLNLGLPNIRYWRRDDEDRYEVRVHANDTELSNRVSASVSDGVFFYELEVTDPMTLSMIKALCSENLPAAQLPKSDDLTIRSEVSSTHAILERKVPEQATASFEAPGFWRIPGYVEDLIIQYHTALAECTYSDVAALKLNELK